MKKKYQLVLLALLLITTLGCQLAGWELAPIQETATCEETSTTCLEAAEAIGAPSGSPICNAPTSTEPAERVESGDQVPFGTITFDAETRVWILENFMAPSAANYSYDYDGREQNLLTAPFVVGSEKNPVNGEDFEICWETTTSGCIPPVAILFFR